MILFLAFVQSIYAIGPGPSWQFYRRTTLSAAIKYVRGIVTGANQNLFNKNF
jgi:hypothetical protein